MLKPVSKPKATQSAFASQEVTFNRRELLNVLDIFNVTETGFVIAEKPKTISKKKKEQNDNQGCNNFNQSSLYNRDSNNRSCSAGPDHIINRKKRNPSIGCGGLLHNFSKCYLTLSQESDLIRDKAREKFQNNMKAASFTKQVDNFRETPKNKTDQ